MTIRALHVASELYPLLKTGGLADVAGALPPALIERGADVRVLLPGFPAVLAGLTDMKEVARIGQRFGAAHVTLEQGKLGANGLIVYVIRADSLYERAGNPYLDAEHVPYGDNGQRFALLGWVAAQLAQQLDPAWTPHIVHAHDWHAGLAPAYLKAAERAQGRALANTVFTIHNLAYQGVFPAQLFDQLELPPDFFDMHGVEFYGQLSFLKAGLYYSDRITTVSPTYSREIQTIAQGGGLDALLRTRTHDLSGILNGVDYTVWNPSTDALLPDHYTSTRLSGKNACKAALQKRFGLAQQSDALLFGVVSRLTEQKGLDLLLAATPEIVRRGGQLVVFGTGDPAIEHGLQRVAQSHPESVAVELGFDEGLAHAIVAGSDVIAVPSRFEPCGLTQLYALAYGSLPLVHCVGGLADTVVDASLENLADDLTTGFVFNHFDPHSLALAIRRAFALYGRRSEWKATMRRAMRQDFGWGASADRYLTLYRELAP
ncbi:glycogen synthase GlgA [Paraburkholderia sp.]|uniref:glycogen synthase GlgA n=1 Tax=Paraburkholderia sp. TaxID=1926495 RepID=UPI002394FF9C|nr:glycogen synthase GlgA [Paraburkholderia sp.]MDE1184561.1 glycogen synthase GlgA [Paraburkholderia sp.]